ncbi:hypothetical protein LWM68_05420 [Niabella sp. W65]|nr:hypothetical protein [Niabella sp. W65]MCH7362253.1 hypothetical protein [Niabella sp. W65]ULT45995.1 hypothetical protein KRR40_24045 [Niabella sp. I65]
MRYLFLILSFIGNAAIAQNLKYTDGNDSWNADTLGNHRFIVNVAQGQFVKNRLVAHVNIPGEGMMTMWRRSALL